MCGNLLLDEDLVMDAFCKVIFGGWKMSEMSEEFLLLGVCEIVDVANVLIKFLFHLYQPIRWQDAQTQLSIVQVVGGFDHHGLQVGRKCDRPANPAVMNRGFKPQIEAR